MINVSRRLTDLNGVASYLGLSADMLRKQIKRGTIDIPYTKYSSRTYIFDLDEVDAWVARRREEARAALLATKAA